MTSNDDSEPQLTFPSEPAPTMEVLIPLHADNWALALASGYLGGSLKADAAEDVQSFANGVLLGFVETVPEWAITAGEPGPRVVLKYEYHGGIDGDRVVSVAAPIRVTAVNAACFLDQAQKDTFHASYDQFPDIPADIVPTTVAGFEVVSEPQPAGMAFGESENEIAQTRQELDFLGGWSSGILSVAALGDVDQGLLDFIALKPQGLELLAMGSLKSIDASSSALDLDIWTATILALRDRFGTRGFDRLQFLADIRSRLRNLDEEAAAWIRGCAKVLNAEIDVPKLDDYGNIGRRAALALMLSHDPASLPEIEHSLGVGPRVRALVTLAVSAFAGLSRLDRCNKSPAARLDAILALSEGFAGARFPQISFKAGSIGADLSRLESVSVDGATVLERTIEAPPYLLMLKARAQEAGYLVTVDEGSGKLAIKARRANAPLVLVDESEDSILTQPIVNLVISIGQLSARPTAASLRSYLEMAGRYSVVIAMKPNEKAVYALASLPLATLDRDELGFYVDRLLSVWESTRSKVKAKRPQKKSSLSTGE